MTNWGFSETGSHIVACLITSHYCRISHHRFSWELCDDAEPVANDHHDDGDDPFCRGFISPQGPNFAFVSPVLLLYPEEKPKDPVQVMRVQGRTLLTSGVIESDNIGLDLVTWSDDPDVGSAVQEFLNHWLADFGVTSDTERGCAKHALEISLTLGLMVNGVAITGHATSYRGLIFSVQHVFELLGKLKVGSELDVVVGDRECK